MAAQNRADYRVESQAADQAGLDHTGPETFARQAMAVMSLHGVSPTPLNFQLWYAHFSGEFPALSRELGALLKSTPAIGNDLCTQIHNRYFGHPGNDRVVDETSQRVHSELERVLKRLKVAENDTSRFGDTLMGYSDSLAGATDSNSLQHALASLVGETRTMEEKSRGLEGELKRSSQEIDKLKRNLEAARLEALTDELTGIGNRKLFEQSLHLAVADSSATVGVPLSLIFCDVDHFKNFNDTWGHKLGDHVLRLVAQQMKDHVAGRGTPARFGGEEFAVILPNVPLAEATALAERLRQAISTKTMKMRSTGVSLGRITMSYGVALHVPGESPDDFVARADRALYAAKAAGRNRVMTEDEADHGSALS